MPKIYSSTALGKKTKRTASGKNNAKSRIPGNCFKFETSNSEILFVFIEFLS